MSTPTRPVAQRRSPATRSPQRALLNRIRQRLAPTAAEPEDSLPLRVLVQALVTIGIIATDIAAIDSADSMQLSLWAVPVSLMGATWSWFQRRKRNIPVKFCIALGMLLALALFLMRLVQERNDTRLALATLLIHLQVLHSFDLPRRKDLGYSAVIGLILLGVAATLSQTLAFAPLLLLFLAIALPVLILDYRSRLGLVSPTFQRLHRDLDPRRLGLFLLLILGLGLAIFLLLPRLPGYQVRSFPVSATIQVEEFDQSAIINPGYVQAGRGSGGTGTGQGAAGSAETGPGEVDRDSYYGFNSRINQNLRGQMQPKLVMRVRSQAPGFWRVLAFDRYTGQGWEISRNAENQVRTYDRPQWSFRFWLPWSVTLNQTREVVQTYTITAELPNLIPVLYEPRELYFPTNQVALDKEGGLRSPIPLTDGLTYTVVSEVPYRDRTRLRQAPAQLPENIRETIQTYYLQLPAAIEQRVRQKTEAILAAAPQPLQAASEKALYLAQYLKQTYRLQLDLPFFGTDEDLVEAFLFKYEGGYPDHFATALTVMLRSIGIPARLVMGFSPGRFNPFTGYYEVQNTDAHAMTEVFFHKYGWFAFDPIPGHALIPPSIEESQTFGVLQQFWNWVAGWLPSPVTGILTRLMQLIGDAITALLSWVAGLFTSGWAGLLSGLGLLTGVAFLGWLGWSGWQVWREHRRWASLPPLEALYQQMLQWLEGQGDRKPAHQTPLEYVNSCRQRRSPEQAAAIEAICHAYVQWRYGGRPANVEQLRFQFDRLRQIPWHQQLRRRFPAKKWLKKADTAQ